MNHLIHFRPFKVVFWQHLPKERSHHHTRSRDYSLFHRPPTDEPIWTIAIFFGKLSLNVQFQRIWSIIIYKSPNLINHVFIKIALLAYGFSSLYVNANCAKKKQLPRKWAPGLYPAFTCIYNDQERVSRFSQQKNNQKTLSEFEAWAKFTKQDEGHDCAPGNCCCFYLRGFSCKSEVYNSWITVSASRNAENGKTFSFFSLLSLSSLKEMVPALHEWFVFSRSLIPSLWSTLRRTKRTAVRWGTLHKHYTCTTHTHTSVDQIVTWLMKDECNNQIKQINR